jgi:hypothetical protein
MRIALVALLLAACELQPAPKQQPAPVIEATPPPPPPADAAVAADAPAVDAGPAPIQASPECLKLAAHLVDVVVASATDPAQKTIYEGERMQMTRSLAESCTNEPWSAASQKCYLATKTPAQIKACEKKFPPKPPAGAGSGAAVAPTPPPPPGPNGMRPEPPTHAKGQTTP